MPDTFTKHRSSLSGLLPTSTCKLYHLGNFSFFVEMRNLDPCKRGHFFANLSSAHVRYLAARWLLLLDSEKFSVKMSR